MQGALSPRATMVAVAALSASLCWRQRARRQRNEDKTDAASCPTKTTDEQDDLPSMELDIIVTGPANDLVAVNLFDDLSENYAVLLRTHGAFETHEAISGTDLLHAWVAAPGRGLGGYNA